MPGFTRLKRSGMDKTLCAMLQNVLSWVASSFNVTVEGVLVFSFVHLLSMMSQLQKHFPLSSEHRQMSFKMRTFAQL